jgi:Leucine-rich repeat (LRR) protein
VYLQGSAVSSLTALNTLRLRGNNVTSEVLRTLSSLTALTTLSLFGCANVTAAGKQALRTAIPNLTIRG